MATDVSYALLRFRGALYRRALHVGYGEPIMTADQVADLLAEQYHNRGRITAEQLKNKWVSSPLFVLTKIYPALPVIGVSAGKTNKTYSTGQPLVIDRDLHDIAVSNPDGSHPRYLVLDGQHRVVKLREEAPFRLYPAYIGVNILQNIRRANDRLYDALKRKRRSVRGHDIHMFM